VFGSADFVLPVGFAMIEILFQGQRRGKKKSFKER
jgi:hypothetical protein